MLLAFLTLAWAQTAPVQFKVVIHGPEDPRLSKEMDEHVRAGVATIEKFFGQPYRKGFNAEVFTNRAALDEFFKKQWQAPPTEKWMVAAGVAEGLYILSPKVWNTEAVGHKDSPKEVRQIVTHELVHIYHAQQNPKPHFDDMEPMAWFIEGLATYVAGQVEGREGQIRQVLEKGGLKNLGEAWQGQARYAVSGSIVRFVDVTYGRKKLFGLLKETTTAGALKSLGVDEATLLQRWKVYEQARLRSPGTFRYLLIPSAPVV